MGSLIVRVAAWVQRRSENVIAALLGIMFVAFIVQIVFRYFFNLPTGWSTELSLVAWLWLVLWGTALALKEKDEIRFDIFTSLAGPRTRRVMAVVVAAATVALYGLSLPGTYKYVTFMKVERSSYLNIRLDWMYSIYVVFVVAIIVRYLWLLWQALRGEPVAEQASSGGTSP
jgi:TRAP-type C4-dicarboxylate transport system permease small subunit